MNKYHSTTQPAAAPVEAPTKPVDKSYLHSRVAGVEVPLAQSVIAGVVVGVPVAVIALLLHAYRWWAYGIVVWLVVQAVAWFVNNRHWFSLTRLEELTGIELDGKPGIGREPIRIELGSNPTPNTRRNQYLEVPCEPEQLSALARGILNGTSLAEAKWTGKGKPFGLPAFRKLRAYLAGVGLVVQDDKTGDWSFTEDGLCFLERYLENE